VFEAQQRNMTMLPGATQVDINADAGLIQARLILDRSGRGIGVVRPSGRRQGADARSRHMV
jgi:hypothetical protein